MKKIYILTIIQLDSDGVISFDTLKFNTREEAVSVGKEQFEDWMGNNGYVDENEATEDDNLTVRITRYDNLLEACDTSSIAEFDYSISEFEV